MPNHDHLHGADTEPKPPATVRDERKNVETDNNSSLTDKLKSALSWVTPKMRTGKKSHVDSIDDNEDRLRNLLFKETFQLSVSVAVVSSTVSAP